MKQTDIKTLPILSFYRYENFFNIHTDSDGFNFYNLLSNISVIPAKNTQVEEDYVVRFNDTWVSISFNYYNTMDLWWLVCAYNQILNPVEKPKQGTVLKLLKPEYVSAVITQLNSQLSK